MEVTITWRIIQWFWPLKPWGSEAAVETPRSVNWPSFFEPRVLACGAHGLVGASGLTRIWRDWLSTRYVIWVCFKVAEKTIGSCHCSTFFLWIFWAPNLGRHSPFPANTSDPQPSLACCCCLLRLHWHHGELEHWSMEMLHIDSISLGTGAQVAGKVSSWRVEVIKWLIYHPKEMLKGNFRVYGPKFCMDAHPSGSYWGLIYYIYIYIYWCLHTTRHVRDKVLLQW